MTVTSLWRWGLAVPVVCGAALSAAHLLGSEGGKAIADGQQKTSGGIGDADAPGRLLLSGRNRFPAFRAEQVRRRERRPTHDRHRQAPSP